MSWDEIRKAVNSDLGVPLNHLIWLYDYKTYGSNSYVFQNKDILYELYESPIAANDNKISTEAFKFAIEQDKIGLFLSKRYSIDLDDSSLITMEDVASNIDAVTAIAKDTPLLNAVFQSNKVDVYLHGIYKNGFQKMNSDIITGLRKADVSGVMTKLTSSSLFDVMNDISISGAKEDCTDVITIAARGYNSGGTYFNATLYNYNGTYSYGTFKVSGNSFGSISALVWDGFAIGGGVTNVSYSKLVAK